jgi:hypothetical protein
MTGLTIEKQLVDPKSLAIDVLQSLNRADSRIDAIVQILEHLKTHLGVSATAIRLNEDGDYPYFLFDGFSDAHIEMEDRLCSYDRDGEILVDELGEPVLECMCGQVIKGKAPTENEFITEYGSFWTNNTDALLTTTSAEDLGATRNVCNAQGYLSVALIPLKTKEGTVGLLQINDEHPDKFTEDLIWFLEGLGESIGIALAHLSEETRRKELEKDQKDLLYQYKLRINQMDCHYKISKIQENKDISTDEMLGLIIALIPRAMQQPDVAVARMDIEDRMYESEGYIETPYRYSAIIQSYGVIMGKLSVGYLVKTPKEFRGPFLEEEVKLINLIAETVSRLLEQGKAGDWNKSIDKYALILADDEISHIMKLVAEDIAINAMDREEYDIRDVPQDSSQTLESYMTLQHNIEVNRAIIIKLQNLLSVD